MLTRNKLVLLRSYFRNFLFHEVIIMLADVPVRKTAVELRAPELDLYQMRRAPNLREPPLGRKSIGFPHLLIIPLLKSIKER
jgi:hypothetical protein